MSSNNVERNIEKTAYTTTGSIQQSTRRSSKILLSSTYALNNSETKSICVGLQANEAEIFELVIKLAGNSTESIYFDYGSWKKFQERFEDVSSYLNGNGKIIPERIIINSVIIHFTTSYGAKAIMLSHNQKSEDDDVGSTAKTMTTLETTAAPPKKKRRTYIPSIVMQKVTFEGLENVASCIDYRCDKLIKILNPANEYVTLLIKGIEDNLPNRILDEDMVKQSLWQNYEAIERVVYGSTMGDHWMYHLAFWEAHFEIFFLELTTVYLNEIVKKIMRNKSSIMSK